MRACMERLGTMNAYRKATRVALMLAACVIGLPVRAQSEQGTAGGAAADLQQIVVGATRTAQPLDRTGSSISVITASDLEQRQIGAVTDILAQTPGLTVSRNGGQGQSSSLYI